MAPSPDRPLVLLVDDHRDSLELYQMGLAEYGFETCASANAADAFALSCARRPDAIVTDVALPGTDGFSLIRQLKGDPRTRDIPILVISGHAGAQTRAEVIAVGARGFLPKPCSVQELDVALREVLSS